MKVCTYYDVVASEWCYYGAIVLLVTTRTTSCLHPLGMAWGRGRAGAFLVVRPKQTKWSVIAKSDERRYLSQSPRERKDTPKVVMKPSRRPPPCYRRRRSAAAVSVSAAAAIAFSPSSAASVLLRLALLGVGGQRSVVVGSISDGYYCGATWVDAVSSCITPCPTGSPSDCAIGETCFAGTPVSSSR